MDKERPDQRTVFPDENLEQRLKTVLQCSKLDRQFPDFGVEFLFLHRFHPQNKHRQVNIFIISAVRQRRMRRFALL